MKLVVHPAAQKEFDRKVDYLRKNGLLPNAADLFVDEIERGLNQIRRDPGRSRMPGSSGYYRAGLTERFSYSLIYQISGETIEVLAMAAPQRRPRVLEEAKILTANPPPRRSQHFFSGNAFDTSGTQILRATVEFLDGNRLFFVLIQGLNQSVNEPGPLGGTQAHGLGLQLRETHPHYLHSV